MRGRVDETWVSRQKEKWLEGAKVGSREGDGVGGVLENELHPRLQLIPTLHTYPIPSRPDPTHIVPNPIPPNPSQPIQTYPNPS